MLLNQIENNMDLLIDEIMSRFTKEDLNTITWRNFIRRTRPYEIKFTKVLKGLFRQQEKEVLSNMRKYPKQIERECLGEGAKSAIILPLLVLQKQNWLSQWLFAEMMWRRRFSNAGKPFIGGVLEDVGQAELTNLVVGIDFDVSNPLVVEFINKNADKFSFATNDATIDQLRKHLIAGVKLGESIPELTKRVNKVFGFAEQYRATRIARTEIIRAANSGAEFAYIQSEVVKGKTWLTSFDERTCEIGCKELNGRKTGLEKPFGKQGVSADLGYTDGVIPFPPLHNNCRCTLTAILIGD